MSIMCMMYSYTNRLLLRTQLMIKQAEKVHPCTKMYNSDRVTVQSSIEIQNQL